MNAKLIAANLEAMHFVLVKATKLSAEVNGLMKRGDYSGAINASLGLDLNPEDAKAPYVAALAFHRPRWL